MPCVGDPDSLIRPLNTPHSSQNAPHDSGDLESFDGDPESLLLPLKETSNVIVLARLQQLRNMSAVNIILAMLTLVYIGVNITCIILNGYDNDVWPQEGVVSKQLFHNLEFWATFVFSCAEVTALVYSPKPLGAIYRNTLLLKLIIFVNITVSFLTSMLVTVARRPMLVASHRGVPRSRRPTLVRLQSVPPRTPR